MKTKLLGLILLLLLSLSFATGTVEEFNETTRTTLMLEPLLPAFQPTLEMFNIAMQSAGVECRYLGGGYKVAPITTTQFGLVKNYFGELAGGVKPMIEGPKIVDKAAVVTMSWRNAVVRMAYTTQEPYVYAIFWCAW